jgi:predicted dienelactone hydrolase
MASHYDTALALASGGFIVVAVTHTGDNYLDQSYAGTHKNLIDRPRQIERVIDFVLSSWPYHQQIDSHRIGIFGFSLGGFTALVEIGGTPDLSRTVLLCDQRPNAPECQFIRQRRGDQLIPLGTTPHWFRDSRVKAVVVVAPALGFLFGPGSLQRARVRVQLWEASADTQAPVKWNAEVVRKELPMVSERYVMGKGDHFIFLAPCSDALTQSAPQICRDVDGFDRVAFHKQFNELVLVFFKKQLNRSRGRRSLSWFQEPRVMRRP